MKKVCLSAALCGVFATVASSLPQTRSAPAGPEHSKLGYFEGAWNYRGVARESPMGPAGNETHTETCEWFEGGFALVCRLEGQGPSGSRKALSILAFDKDRQEYVFFGIDNLGGPYKGYGGLEEDTWTFTYEFPSGGRLVKLRSTYVEVSSTRYEMKVEVSRDDGSWVTSIEGIATKEGGP